MITDRAYPSFWVDIVVLVDQFSGWHKKGANVILFVVALGKEINKWFKIMLCWLIMLSMLARPPEAEKSGQ
jgi:hypothetical protein